MDGSEDSSELDERIYVEQISLLYGGSVYRPALNLISLTVFVLIIINHVNPFYAYTWALLLFGLNIYRFIDLYKTSKILNEIKDFNVIHKRYAYSAGLLGAVYGLGFVFFFNQLPMLNQVYLMTLISLMVPAGWFLLPRTNYHSICIYIYWNCPSSSGYLLKVRLIILISVCAQLFFYW